MTTLLTGGSGLLGRELLRLDPSIVAPPRDELDVTDEASVARAFARYAPSLVIHAAAFTDDRKVRKDPARAVAVNIEGTARIARAAIEGGARLVYLSTDYVYAGKGPHKEDEPVAPANPYAVTKLGGECAVRLVPNHLIIRTSFGPPVFPYECAFEDMRTSKDDVDRIAPRILAAARSPATGVLNIGTEPKTMYDYATRRRPGVLPRKIRPARRAEVSPDTPADATLDLARWERLVADGTISYEREHNEA